MLVTLDFKCKKPFWGATRKNDQVTCKREKMRLISDVPTLHSVPGNSRAASRRYSEKESERQGLYI